MSKVFLNGEFLNEEDAKVSINDAGYYFGDGVYEVILIYKRKFIDYSIHLDRLMSCFQKVFFKNYPTKEEIFAKAKELLDKNPEIDTGSIYIQFTRGITQRSHSFAELDLKPNFMMKIRACELNSSLKKKWHCNVVEDPRRIRCDIKMISLLPMVLAKYESEKAGFDDVIFFNSKVNSITEGSAFNIFIVDHNDTIITYPVSNEILPGCTRARIISFIKEKGYKLEERCFTKDELFNAKEVFATGALKVIIPIVKIVGQEVGNGEVGEITKDLNNIYLDFLENSTNE